MDGRSAFDRAQWAGDPNPDYGGRTALRWLQRPRAASSVSWLSPPAFSRSRYIRVGLTFVGIRLTGTTELQHGPRTTDLGRTKDEGRTKP